ncbi:MAG: gliding motility-associated ABC transporter permease subunit GldF [Bacteroidia bacterium]|nr:gliding motility-associated ABC transporter permease subunit GldF [Bacteroidia bacterium]MCC6768461.1 gliding motility-associated ABC transporter permease subunit GldF [Bacteroidia bacterium]
MFALLKKEVAAFLNSLVGYIVISVFLLAMGLSLWLFPGSFNIPQGGVSSLENYFVLAPWVFMFLIPAITMRSFAEERRTGTIELLLTRPLTEWHIVLAKYLAGLVLVTLAIVPTLIYFYSVYMLGNPVGNIDTGSTIGSYLGLLLLAAAFVAVGNFASVLSDNQIVAFLLGFFLCFFLFAGFDSIATMKWLGRLGLLVSYLGISEHYSSMSRGVVDSRDLVYFFGFILLFLTFTRFRLLGRKW